MKDFIIVLLILCILALSPPAQKQLNKLIDNSREQIEQLENQ